VGLSKKSIGEFLIGNRFHVNLRILSPDICKQSLRVKSWKVELRAEKAIKLKNKMNKSGDKLTNQNIVANWLTPRTQAETNKSREK